MSVAKGLGLGVALLVAGLLAAGIWAFFERPLAVHAWMGRRALTGGGISETPLEAPAGRLTYWKGGSGPVLVLLHGAGDQAGTWSEIAGSLAESHALLVPDLPGHGGSEPRKGPITFAMLLSGLESVLDREAPAGRVTLVGNSLGAWLACIYAARHPERVERVVAVNGGPLRGEGAYGLMPQDRAEARRLMEALRAPESVRIPEFVLDDVVRQARSGPIARLAAGGDLERHLMDGRLHELTVPVDLLWGEADRAVPLDYARKMAAELPNVRLTRIPRCGHVPQQECPGPFRQLLEGLLREAPPRGAVPKAP